MINEAGPWEVYDCLRRTDGAPKGEIDQRVGVASDDFEHDVILWVYGDFEDRAQRLEYAAEIAKRLNAYKPDSANGTEP